MKYVRTKDGRIVENTYSQSITVSMLPVDMRVLNELAKKPRNVGVRVTK